MKKDKRKIVLGTKDVLPKENNDIFLNIELSSHSDELVKEVVDNNFNSRQQFNEERESSLKFCIYGLLSSKFIDTENLTINIKTNHDDTLYSPRIKGSTNVSESINVTSQNISFQNKLSKNIFIKNKSSFYAMFELSPDYNNFGETKKAIITIEDLSQNIFFKKK